MSAPVLDTLNITDPIVRRNFQNLADYYARQGQFDDFQFKELVFTEATSNFRMGHSLGLVPKDVVLTRLTGAGSVTFNFALFDANFLDISVSGPCRVRFFFGTRATTGAQTNGTSTEAQTYNSGG